MQYRIYYVFIFIYINFMLYFSDFTVITKEQRSKYRLYAQPTFV